MTRTERSWCSGKGFQTALFRHDLRSPGSSEETRYENRNEEARRDQHRIRCLIEAFDHAIGLGAAEDKLALRRSHFQTVFYDHEIQMMAIITGLILK